MSVIPSGRPAVTAANAAAPAVGSHPANGAASDSIAAQLENLEQIATHTVPFGATPALRPGVHHEPLPAERLLAALPSYNTRYLAEHIASMPFGFDLRTGSDVVPQPGDVLLARVVSLGHVQLLETPESRKSKLFPGQEILVAYGHRYAPDMYLSYVPASLEPCHLAAAGGLASKVEESHASVDGVTRIEPLGLLCDSDGVINLRDHAPHQLRPVGDLTAQLPPVIAVLGSSMNSGKSTTAACLINGLTNAGHLVAAAKVTGTGSGNDVNLFKDAGAVKSMDFTHFGYTTTFQMDYAEVCQLLTSTIAVLAEESPSAIVIEISDGILQGETGRLLRDPLFHSAVDATIFAAQEALGVLAGSSILREAGVKVAAISGVVTASPLAASEAAAQVPERIIPTYDLCDPEVARGLIMDIAAG